MTEATALAQRLEGVQTRHVLTLDELGQWYELAVDAKVTRCRTLAAPTYGLRSRRSEATVYLDDFAVSVVPPTETPTVEPSASPTPGGPCVADSLELADDAGASGGRAAE